MRIISGKLRGKILKTPTGLTTRPTSDRAREMIFNILNSYFLKQGINWSDVSFADVFAGSGAIGLEALSRGTKEVFFFETDKEAKKCLLDNIKGITAVSVFEDALYPPQKNPITILFMDAPYGKGLWQQALKNFLSKNWIDEKTLIVIETDKLLAETLPNEFSLLQTRSAGRNVFLLAKLKGKN